MTHWMPYKLPSGRKVNIRSLTVDEVQQISTIDVDVCDADKPAALLHFINKATEGSYTADDYPWLCRAIHRISYGVGSAQMPTYETFRIDFEDFVRRATNLMVRGGIQSKVLKDWAFWKFKLITDKF